MMIRILACAMLLVGCQPSKPREYVLEDGTRCVSARSSITCDWRNR